MWGIGCRRRRSGRRRRGAGAAGSGFRGATPSRTVRRIITVLRATPTTPARRGATTQRLAAFHPIRVRRGISRRTCMGYTTWRGTCGSGVGIGIRVCITVRRQLQTHVVLHRARAACLGAAVGTPTRSAAGRRAATTTPRRTGTSSSDSVVFDPQVSKSRKRSSRVGARESCRSAGLQPA